MNQGKYRPWSADDDALLTKLWSKNSAKVIGDKMDRSRNGIIGRAHRLGLAAKAKPRPRAERKKIIPQKALVQDEKPPVVRSLERIPPQYVPPTQIWTGEGVPLLEATHGQCRAILGSSNDLRGLAIYCGAPVVEGQSFSFCEKHLALFISSRGN